MASGIVGVEGHEVEAAECSRVLVLFAACECEVDAFDLIGGMGKGVGVYRPFKPLQEAFEDGHHHGGGGAKAGPGGSVVPGVDAETGIDRPHPGYDAVDERSTSFLAEGDAGADACVIGPDFNHWLAERLYGAICT